MFYCLFLTWELDFTLCHSVFLPFKNACSVSSTSITPVAFHGVDLVFLGSGKKRLVESEYSQCKVDWSAAFCVDE